MANCFWKARMVGTGQMGELIRHLPNGVELPPSRDALHSQPFALQETTLTPRSFKVEVSR